MSTVSAASISKHGKEVITDPVEEMLKKTGCIELHYKVQVMYFGEQVFFLDNHMFNFRNALLLPRTGENVRM